MTKNDDNIKPCKNSWRAKNTDGYYVMHKPTYGESLEHRYVYVKNNGEIPKGKVVRHTCNNPSCVEPTHLILGTQFDNVMDSVKAKTHKNPSFNGSKNPAALLTEEEVLEIRAMHSRGKSQGEIARWFFIDRVTVTNIVNRKTWRHI